MIIFIGRFHMSAVCLSVSVTGHLETVGGCSLRWEMQKQNNFQKKKKSNHHQHLARLCAVLFNLNVSSREGLNGDRSQALGDDPDRRSSWSLFQNLRCVNFSCFSSDTFSWAPCKVV